MGSVQAYLMHRLATAVHIARYVDGGADQSAIGMPFEATSIPNEAIMLTLANSIQSIPESGPNRKNVVLQGV